MKPCLVISLTVLSLMALCQKTAGIKEDLGSGLIDTKEAIIDKILSKLESVDSVLSRLEAVETRQEKQEEENFLLSRKLKNEQQKVMVFKNKENPTAATVVSGDVDSQIAAIFPRSCQEIYDQNPTISVATNGPQYIDPDGPGVGEPPIFVECTDGVTKVEHDISNALISVNGISGNYSNAGSYTRDINYQGGATIRQMSALAALSTSCRQKFIYKCKQAYFQLNGVQYSWWVDRYGNRQFFWSGNFKPGTTEVERHTCQCGIPGNPKCSDSQFVCNCDIFPTATNLQFIDEGYITEKSLLPITQLKLGKIVGSTIYTVGDLECSGSQGTQIGEPNSCRDLYQLGHTLNGFYTVRGLGVNSNNIETVFCNFRVPAIDGNFETRLGILCNECQRTTAVYFYVQGPSYTVTGHNYIIPFDKVLLNVGMAVNPYTGTFTAPVNGIYFFSFSGYKCANYYTSISLRLNGFNNVAYASYSGMGYDAYVAKYSLEATLQLNQGDFVNLVLEGCITDTLTPNYRVTHFTGWLLDERVMTGPDK